MDLRVLGYVSKTKEWAAHCLETDLVGFGKTFDEALAELKELTEMQITFAVEMNETNLLDRPASLEIFDLWARASRWEIENFLKVKRKGQQKYCVKTIPLARPSSTESSFVTA